MSQQSGSTVLPKPLETLPSDLSWGPDLEADARRHLRPLIPEPRRRPGESGFSPWID
jgi:hypothetical protein